MGAPAPRNADRRDLHATSEAREALHEPLEGYALQVAAPEVGHPRLRHVHERRGERLAPPVRSCATMIAPNVTAADIDPSHGRAQLLAHGPRQGAIERVRERLLFLGPI